MSTFTKHSGSNARSKHKTREEWAEIWFHKLADFHGVKDRKGWRFTRGDVICGFDEIRVCLPRSVG